MRRFFIEPTAITDRQAILQGADARHLRKVLRLQNGDEVELFSGDGLVHQARISGGAHDRVELAILASNQRPPADLRLHLGQAMLKSKKMDLVIQKCTELGVAAIHPYLSHHTKVPAPEPAKIQRWQKIIRESCKQCNQPWPPVCRPEASFEQALAAGADCDLRLLCWEDPTAAPLREVADRLTTPRSLMVLIGPEGGFSNHEVEAAKAAGFLTVGLGRRILRAETAAIATIALLQYIFNDL